MAARSGGPDGHHVFGYASLLGDMRREEEELCRLRGYRRGWNVATDNSLTLGRYKIYLDPHTGEQPPVFVTFVNLLPDGDGSVAGILFPVTPAQLADLDLRERNYERRDVSSQLEESVAGPVWCYFGTAQAEARYQEGLAAGRAVVNRAYHEQVREGFAAFGAEALREFQATTEEPQVPDRRARTGRRRVTTRRCRTSRRGAWPARPGGWGRGSREPCAPPSARRSSGPSARTRGRRARRRAPRRPRRRAAAPACPPRLANRQV